MTRWGMFITVLLMPVQLSHAASNGSVHTLMPVQLSHAASNGSVHTQHFGPQQAILAATQRASRRSPWQRAADCAMLQSDTHGANVSPQRWAGMPPQRWSETLTPVFGIGAFKTGSTSLQRALALSGHLPPCKTAWGGTQPWSGSALDASWDIHAVADLISSVQGRSTAFRGSESLRQAITHCGSLQDAPWMYTFPTLMAALPSAKFVLTRWPSCGLWAYHFSGLLNCNAGARAVLRAGQNKSLLDCFYFSGREGTTAQLIERCEQHERSAVLTARALKMPLLVLDTTWNSTEKWTALDSFLHTNQSMIAARTLAHGTEFPHVATKSCGKEESWRPTRPDDRNADLFAGTTPQSPVIR